MIGLMDKGGQGTAQVPGQQNSPMNLSALFQGLQQPAQTQVPQIGAPQYGGSLMPSPEQAAAATRARMLARNPIMAPAAQPQRPAFDPMRGGNGDSHGRGSGGAW